MTGNAHMYALETISRKFQASQKLITYLLTVQTPKFSLLLKLTSFMSNVIISPPPPPPPPPLPPPPLPPPPPPPPPPTTTTTTTTAAAATTTTLCSHVG